MKKSWKLFTSVFVVHMLFLLVTASFTTSCSPKEKPESSSFSQTATVRTNKVEPSAESQQSVTSSAEERAPGRDDSEKPKDADSLTGEPPAAPRARLPRMVDLGADKCVPCKMMAPILRDLKSEFKGKVDVEFIDVWKNPNPGRQYRIRVIPTQIFLDIQGRELFRHEGFYSREDILTKWRELGFLKE